MAEGLAVLVVYVTTLLVLIVSVYFIFARPSRKHRAENGHEREGDLVEDEDGAVPVQEPRELRNMTKKEIMKAEKKKLKADRRAYFEAEREAREERLLKKEEAQRERDALREAAEIKKQMERDQRRRVEEEQKKQEYDQRKKSISIYDCDQNLNTNSVKESLSRYLREKKVVFIEEAAIEFNMRVSDCLKLISELEQRGTILGILDDHGKYICVDDDELDSMADFINRRGRVSMTFLAREASKIIKVSHVFGDSAAPQGST